MNASPWNKDRVVGQKPALSFEQVRAIRTVLVSAGTARDRALFALAVDSSFREGDLLGLRTSDVVNFEGIVRPTLTLRPSKTKKTGITVTFEPTDYTRTQLAELIEENELSADNFLFTRMFSKSRPTKHLSTRAFRDLVKKWVSYIGLDPQIYGTHSLRRTRPAHVYAQTGNLRACQLMLGHARITTTQEYLGIDTHETLEIARRYQI